MRVVYRPTGQMGDIPDEKFDPRLFSPAQTQSAAPTDGAPQQDAQPSWLENVFSAVTKPLRVAGEGLNDLRRVGSNAVYDATGGKQGVKITGDEKPVFLSNEENQTMQKNVKEHPIRETAKLAAGLGSYAVPGAVGGAGIGGAMTAGALSGGLYGASQDDANIQSVATSAATGALAGGVLKGGGQVYSGLRTMLGKGAAQNLTKASPSVINKAIEEHGFNINDVAAKHIPEGSSYDDILGHVSQRNRGGVIGTKIAEAEGKIQDGIANAGDEIVATHSDLVKPLMEMRDRLSQLPGNADKIRQLDDFITEMDRYKSGVNAQELLNIKRNADESFGKAVVDDTHGAVNNQAQKLLGNTARQKLKDRFSDISDALDTESELYTLKPVISSARAQEIASSKIKPSSIDVSKPAAVFDGVFNNPKVASTLAQTGRGAADVAQPVEEAASATLRQKANDAVGNAAKTVNTAVVKPATAKLARTATETPGNLLTSVFQQGADDQPNEVDTNNNQNNSSNHEGSIAQTMGQSQGMITIKNSKTGETKQVPAEDLAKYGINGSQSGVPTKEQLDNEYFNQLRSGGTQGRANAAAILQTMKQYYPNQSQKPMTGQQQLNATNAESGLRALTTIEKQLKENPGVMAKETLPGIAGRIAGASTYRTARKEASDVLTRLRTGAALNAEEQSFYASQLPQVGDSPKDIQYKLQMFKDLFEQVAHHQKGALPDAAAANDSMSGVFAQ